MAADGDALEEALARQLARQKNPRASVVPVEVRAGAPVASSVTTSMARATLLQARSELEAFIARAKRPVDARARS